MADIKFSCPRCNQHITCDELWSGHQIKCPTCQGELAVPSRPAPAPAPAPVPAEPTSLAPKPPSGAAPRLSIGQAHAPHGGPGAQTPPRSIPIRNLAPPAPPKKNKFVQIAKVAATLLVLGAGGYFGFTWIMAYQEKANDKAKAEENRSGGGAGQVGHIMALNNVLDATEPGGRGLGSLGQHPASGPRDRSSGSANIAVPDGDEGGFGMAAPEKKLPLVAPVWAADLVSSKIPEGRANGSISATNFVVETARVDQVGSAHVLRLLQGQTASPDREVLVYLHLKPGEKLGGQSLAISPDMRGVGVPQVAKRWKADPRFAPKLQSYNSGYVMKLELAAMTNGTIPGKIFLALPDPEKSVVGGLFRITPSLFEMDAQTTPVAAPGAVPVARPVPRAGKSAVNDRYGIQ